MAWKPFQWLAGLVGLTSTRAPRELVDAATVREVPMGRDFAEASDTGTGPSYPAEWSMSALGSFPWVYAAVMARASDAASLPKYLVDRRRPSERIFDHPAMDLLEEPMVDVTQVEWMRQVMVDLQLSGTAFWLDAVPSGADPRNMRTVPDSLVRLHPRRMRVRTKSTYPVTTGWTYDTGEGEPRFYPREQVRRVRYPTFEDGPRGEFGQGLIRALHDELVSERAATRQTRRVAEDGRPYAVLSPSDPGDEWDKGQREAVRDAFLRQSRAGGPLVIGAPVKVDQSKWTPADLEMPELRDFTRQTIMAAARVAPVVLGRETANFATAEKQEEIHWLAVVHDVRLIDSKLSLSVRRFDPNLRVKTDFDGVEALARIRGRRIDRASKLVKDFGVTPKAALAAEGIHDVDAPDTRLDSFATASAPLEPRDLVMPPPVRHDRGDTADEARLRAWRRYMRRSYEPGRRAIANASRSYLRAALKRYQSRVKSGLSGREWERVRGVYRSEGLVGARASLDWEDVLGELEEQEQIRAVVGGAWRRVWKLAATAAVEPLPVDGLSFDPDRPEVVFMVNRLSQVVGRTTANAVRAIVEDGLAEGATIGDLQAALADAAAFGPSRALLWGRTEATRATNRGTLSAFQEAAQVVDMRKQWLTGGSNVRESHEAMDGQTRAVDEDFVSGDGNRSLQPGGFDNPAEDCNCACTMVAVVKSKPVL